LTYVGGGPTPPTWHKVELMKLSIICFKNKAQKAAVKKKKPVQQHYQSFSRRDSLRLNASNPYLARRKGRRVKPSRNNLQLLYKRKSHINQKLRVRKFKLRVSNADAIRRTSRGLTRPRRGSYLSLRTTRALRLTYGTMLGFERSFMTRLRAKIHYRKYPDFFVTKKSSKSRMGKGKGKIVGRVVKIKRGESIVDLRFRNYLKSPHLIRALRQAIPCTTRLVYRNKTLRRLLLTDKKKRPWRSYALLKKRKKKWQLDLERASLLRQVNKMGPGYRRYFNRRLFKAMLKAKFKMCRRFIKWRREPRLKEQNERKMRVRRHFLVMFRT
jgi:ribosomal protein L16/L10AE